MKVKIGNTTYDSTKQPIMIILSDSDKENIKNMLPHCTKYCSFPDGKPQDEVRHFMEID